MLLDAGLGICSLFFQANRSFFVNEKAKNNSLFSKEQIAILLFCSFVKSDKSKMLPLLFKKERRSKERQERFALGHKKGKNSEILPKHGETTNFF